MSDIVGGAAIARLLIDLVPVADAGSRKGLAELGEGSIVGSVRLSYWEGVRNLIDAIYDVGRGRDPKEALTVLEGYADYVTRKVAGDGAPAEGD